MGQSNGAIINLVILDGGHMRARISHFAIILPMLFLAACATTPVHQVLPADAEAKIASTDVVLPIHQSEIYVYVPPSTAGAQAGAQGGLVGALVGAIIDSSINDARTSKAETSVKPLRDALVDYNYDAALQSNVKQSLGQIAWVHGEDYRVVRDITPNGLDGVLNGSKDSAVLLVVCDYRLSNDGSTLDVTTLARLFPNDDALKTYVAAGNGNAAKSDERNTIYRNSFLFEVRLPNATDDRDQNITAWSANNGAAMREALGDGARHTAEMLAADLQDGDRPGAGATTVNADPPATGYPTAGVAVATTGQIISNSDGGQLVRMDDGTLRYTAAAPAMKPAAPPASAAAAPAAPAAAFAPSAQSGVASAQPAS
jgi:hypothetical protein